MKIDRLYQELGDAIANAETIPPCMVSDPESWFPDSLQVRSSTVENAKRLCMACPVQAQCLAYALANPGLEGIWGGATPKERMNARTYLPTTRGRSRQGR